MYSFIYKRSAKRSPKPLSFSVVATDPRKRKRSVSWTKRQKRGPRWLGPT